MTLESNHFKRALLLLQARCENKDRDLGDSVASIRLDVPRKSTLQTEEA